MMSEALISLRDFRVSFPTMNGDVQAVRGVDLDVREGELLAVVGESGSGKSVTFLGTMGLLPPTTRISGSAVVCGTELVGAPLSKVRRACGKDVAMIFQDPLSALNPVQRIVTQITEMLQSHQHISKAAAFDRTVDLLDMVGIPQPKDRAMQYPHEFSGGMRQRVMIAMALVCNPQLLIADEPTTALDVTVQAQILDLMRDLQAEFNSAIILITHDLGVVAEIADDVTVMYGGRAVEQGSVRDVFYSPQMPYTWGLLASMPRLDRERKGRLDPIPGNPPSLINLPNGCVFSPRCVYRDRVGTACVTERPDLVPVSNTHRVRCHIPSEQSQSIWIGEVQPRL